MFSYSSINKYNIQSEEFKFPVMDYLNQELEECFNVDGAR
jgi:hypothetical protein